MFLRSLRMLGFVSGILLIASSCSHRELRVCADPNNMPFSNQREEGFENRIADVIAGELHASVTYTWWAQRRGFIRNTLSAHECDVVLGLPSRMEMALVTKPYYRSTYVFVVRQDSGLHIQSLDDPILHRLRIGVHVVGDDYAATPPAAALARRGLVQNLTGFSIYGDYSQENPPARIIDAVKSGDIDVAIVWGPLGGYYTAHSEVPLELHAVWPVTDAPSIPLAYDISIGVRKGDQALKDEIQSVLDRKRTEIGRILEEYGVPRV
jgi:mxaJ protein